MIRITLKEGVDVDAKAKEVEDILLASHRVTEDEKDFGVLTPTFINNQLGSVLDLIAVFLGGIASIALLVGGIGISNTMFMSVMERRKEIGTMKALGASQKQIRNLFLLESSLIGFVGGCVGVVLALFVGFLITFFANIAFLVDPMTILEILLFSMGIGTISGTFPAVEAAKVDPMVALRAI